MKYFLIHFWFSDQFSVSWNEFPCYLSELLVKMIMKVEMIKLITMETHHLVNLLSDPKYLLHLPIISNEFLSIQASSLMSAYIIDCIRNDCINSKNLARVNFNWFKNKHNKLPQEQNLFMYYILNYCWWVKRQASYDCFAFTMFILVLMLP